jgi:RNA-directed DNA polymerase
MKRSKSLIDKITDLDNIYLAYHKAKRGKSYANNVLQYSDNLEYNVQILKKQMEKGQIKIGEYKYFTIFEPKLRLICASAFDEQVLHHSLMNICHDKFESVQIFDSYASRIGKGSYRAIARAQTYSRQTDWYLKLDVRKFFNSVHHNVLKSQIDRLFKEIEVNRIFYGIIDSYTSSKEGRGLPIGNLTSQYFANHYLSGLDHYIKEELKVKRYVRYMDDMVLWSNDKNYLKTAFASIRNYVQAELRCELKPEILGQTKLGLPFLGYKILPYQIWLLQASKCRFFKKMTLTCQNYDKGKWSESSCSTRVRALCAFAEHAQTKELKRKWYAKQFPSMI